MVATLRNEDVEVLELAGRYVKTAIEAGEPDWRAWYVEASKGYKKGKKRKDKKK
jgi:hypothetical protein